MNKITKNIAALSVGVLTFGAAYVTNVQSAQAWPGWRTEELGTATTTDNGNYWKAKGKIALPSPPSDRNDLCRWKTGRSDAKGEAKSWFGADNWKTRCYRTYWVWW